MYGLCGARAFIEAVLPMQYHALFQLNPSSFFDQMGYLWAQRWYHEVHVKMRNLLRKTDCIFQTLWDNEKTTWAGLVLKDNYSICVKAVPIVPGGRCWPPEKPEFQYCIHYGNTGHTDLIVLQQFCRFFRRTFMLWISHATSSPKFCSIRFKYGGWAAHCKNVKLMSFSWNCHAHVPGQL